MSGEEGEERRDTEREREMDEETVKGGENRAEKKRVSVCALMCVAHSISASQRHRL